MTGTASSGAAGAKTLADVLRASQNASLTATDGTAVFGSVEVRSESLTGLPQWTRVLAVMQAEAPAFDRCTTNAAECATPVLKNWRKIITSAKSLNRRDKLMAVNNFFNRWPYKLDPEIYGLSEYWATPREFMTRSGDCEDFSIAKYFALRELGFSRDEMRIVILMDEIRGIGHAVLAIYEGNDILVLDSLSNLILSHSLYRHYKPQYSMNETTRWAHIGSFKKQSTKPYQGLAASN
ncbi:MAG: transglutaminase-like cysteine peptidase [Alphaproteobacteria bacterium]